MEKDVFNLNGLATLSLNQKDSPWNGNRLNLRLLKKMVSEVAFNKEGHADSLLENEMTHDFRFP